MLSGSSPRLFLDRQGEENYIKNVDPNAFWILPSLVLDPRGEEKQVI